jgi:predicted dehydrogenase
MCDHTYSYRPAVRHIREPVHGGELGALQFIDSVRINLGLVQSDIDWDLAPHDLSILDFVLPANQTAASSRDPSARCSASAERHHGRLGRGRDAIGGPSPAQADAILEKISAPAT